MMLNSPTWIFPARSGSSLIAKMPRLALGRSPKCIVSSSESTWPPRAPEMHRELVREHVAAARSANRIEVADEIGDGDVRGRELLDVTVFAMNPGDGGRLAFGFDALTAVLADRAQWIVVHLAPGHDRQPFVEELGQAPQDSALRLPAQTKQ